MLAKRNWFEFRISVRLSVTQWSMTEEDTKSLVCTGTHTTYTYPPPQFKQKAAHNQHSLLLGFHLNNQLTQSLTSRYRDSRLRVDFERFVSCAARLTCIFRECCSWLGGYAGVCLRTSAGYSPCLSNTGHCSQHLDGGEGVVCLTHKQVS